MGNVSKVVNDFLSLTAEEQGKVTKLILGLQTSPTKVSAGEKLSSNESLLYSEIWDSYMSRHGKRLPPLSILCQGTSAWRHLQEAAQWLEEPATAASRPLTKQQRLGLYRLAAQAVSWEVAADDREVRNTKELAEMLVRNLPLTMERAYPGYRLTGFLYILALGATQSKKPNKFQQVDFDH